MANLTFWRTKEGKLIVDANNRPIKCDHCPCSSSPTFGCDRFKGTSITVEVWEVYCVNYDSDGNCIEAGWDYRIEGYTGTYSSCVKRSNGQFEVYYTIDRTFNCAGSEVSLVYSANGEFVSGHDPCRNFPIIPKSSPPPGGLVARLMKAPI